MEAPVSRDAQVAAAATGAERVHLARSADHFVVPARSLGSASRLTLNEWGGQKLYGHLTTNRL